MPFDGLTISSLSIRNLPTSLRNIGIEPVPMAVLKKHKADEIAKHPSSFFWNRDSLFAISCITSFFVTIGLCMMTAIAWSMYSGSHIMTPLGFTVALVVSATLLLRISAFTTVKGPAHWIEAHAVSFHNTYGRIPLALKDAPEPVVNLARYLAEKLPNASFVVGTLYQQETQLDPYLLIEQFDAQGTYQTECLAIWDDDRIIHLAG